MRIHHLNCISSCPLGGWLMDGRAASVFERGRLCCHCLLVESNDGLVLVDTGFGLQDIARPRERLSRFFLSVMSPDFKEEMTALRQIEALGHRAADVRHIVLTHLDFDHAGGLDDFPDARVHLLATERDSALAQATWLDRQRYRPEQWSGQGRWVVHGVDGGEPWQGFDGCCTGNGLPQGIALVPLAGHTLGHAGVAIRGGAGWVLQAGDAYFDRRELDPHPRCRLGLRLYQALMEKDRRARLANQRRLRELKRQRGDVCIVCSHDPAEFEQVSQRGLDAPQRLAVA
ncbi:MULTISPECIES: MBL fold metallo-hydrolase [unclassified Rhizobacter]|uniref:MBL fold metallo-hydrolase n=1 Tax=unclassified Rhizobacter TaxID=2640088 RepID=UPI0006FA2663|nr:MULTISPECIES: MBL fold metallo-hydrolase [unclassified Rhizobacter]KQU71448.1 MBL fold metallo-hydrolase [Rhizobacter sp. Root29]KQW13063.1 MBL fold metallo-hydrolase [Rhizobacter sp. Root1238]KRB14370.1 MBL fold metallo-hydrolase [Rhizobacter sp. Root16D2]